MNGIHDTKFSTKEGILTMPKPRTSNGKKNMIAKNLLQLRQNNNLSQRDLAHKLQLNGYDIDRNVITRIETNQRYVTDIEIAAFCQIFHVTFEDLIKESDLPSYS